MIVAWLRENGQWPGEEHHASERNYIEHHNVMVETEFA